MISDDAVNATIGLSEKLMQIVLELLKFLNENRNHNKSSGKNVSTPKIKAGELKFADYKKMLENGEKMRVLNVHTDKVQDIKELSKVMGANFWVLETNGNNTILSVPEVSMPQLQDVISVLNQRQLSENPGSLSVKNANESVPGEDIGLVRSVLDYHDIPVYSFQKTDGSYMNIVPKDFDGQYKAAMETVAKLKSEMQNIDVAVFDQKIPFSNIVKEERTTTEINSEQAEYLAKEQPCKEMKFYKDENGKIAVSYPAQEAGKIEKCLNNLSENIAQAEEYLIHITDKTITINKDKLVKGENESEYFTQIPNTAAQDFLRIPKSETELTDGGKTIKTKLDFDKTYQIMGEDGVIKSQCSGKELAEKYNTKSKFANKDTDTYRYHNDNLERIELFNASENKLIRIGIENAETIRRDLSEQGITGYAADKLLADIDKALPEEYREKFGFVQDKTEVLYEEISSDMLIQYALAEKLKGCNCADKDNDPDVLGKKCCVLDKSTDQYVLVSANEDRLRDSLAKMGYDNLHINAVVAEVQKSHTVEGAALERESVQVHSFETTNAEAQQYSYATDSNGITIIKGDITGDEASFKYLQIDKDTDRGEIESALKKGFNMQDTATVASIIKCLEDKGLLTPADSVTTRDGFEIAPVTNDYVNISRDGSSVLMDKNNVNTDTLCKKFGIDEKQAEKLGKTIKSAAVGKKGVYKSINEIKTAAKQLQQKFSTEKAEKAEKSDEIKTPLPSSERSK